MHTAIRIGLAVAGVVAVGGAAVLLHFVFRGAVGCATVGSALPSVPAVLQHALLDQAAFVTLAYFLLCVGYLFGVQSVVPLRGLSRRTPFHLMIAVTLASATAVTVAATAFLPF